MLSLQHSLQQESGLAVYLTCPLSKKTECFNKVSPLTRLSLRGTTSLWAALDWISSGRFIVLLRRTETEKSTWNSPFQWNWFIFSNAREETNRAATDTRRTKEWMSSQSATGMLSWMYNLTLFDGTVISHKHIHSLQQRSYSESLRHKSKWKSSLLVPWRSTVIVSLSGSLGRGNVSSLFPQGFFFKTWNSWRRDAPDFLSLKGTSREKRLLWASGLKRDRWTVLGTEGGDCSALCRLQTVKWLLRSTLLSILRLLAGQDEERSVLRLFGRSWLCCIVCFLMIRFLCVAFDCTTLKRWSRHCK